MLKKLEKISAKCESCQKITNSPHRFRVSLGSESIHFNSRVYLDIIYLDGKPVLHLMDEGTCFSATQFLESVCIPDIRESILFCWEKLYIGLPHEFMTDQDSQFKKTFAELESLHEVSVEQTGIQPHNSMHMNIERMRLFVIICNGTCLDKHHKMHHTNAILQAYNQERIRNFWFPCSVEYVSQLHGKPNVNAKLYGLCSTGFIISMALAYGLSTTIKVESTNGTISSTCIDHY